MKIMLMLWLLILQHPLKSDATCEPGDIRILNGTIINQNNLAGRMELCDDEGDWRAVCAGQWDTQDARVACRQMGFSDQVESSTDSHYGRSSLNKRFYQFDCDGDEQNLLDCNKNADENTCVNDAGVECSARESETETIVSYVVSTNFITLKELMVTTVIAERGQCTQVAPSITLQTSCTVTPPSMQAAAGNMTGTGHPQANCAALSGGLGVLAALMALGMVGVVLGWVWSCQKRKGKATIQERTADHALFENPAYSTTSVPPPCPLVRYGSTGPQDNPTHGTLEGVSSTYDIIKNDPSLTEGEHDYQVLEEMEGGTYEVPVNTGRNITSIDDNQEDYSMLQHQ